MRSLIAVVVLLVIVLVGVALAADPPGGPGWYQLSSDSFISVPFEGGQLVIAGGTPGLLVGAQDGFLKIRFERGVATARGKEITSDGTLTERDALTLLIDPSQVKAFVKQPLSKARPPADSPTRAGAEPGALGALGGGVGAGVGTGAVGVQRDTTLVLDDTVNVVRRATADAGPAAAGGGGGGTQVFPPSASGTAGGGVGRPGRVIARDEHDARLVKVLRLLDEDGARCETKPYGPGWVSVCESVRDA